MILSVDYNNINIIFQYINKYLFIIYYVTSCIVHDKNTELKFNITIFEK